jgi:hypothetical protein
MGQHHPSVLDTLTHIARVRAPSFPHCITVTSFSAPRLHRPPPPRPPPPAPSTLYLLPHPGPRRRRNLSAALQAMPAAAPVVCCNLAIPFVSKPLISLFQNRLSLLFQSLHRARPDGRCRRCAAAVRIPPLKHTLLFGMNPTSPGTSCASTTSRVVSATTTPTHW